MRITEEVQRVLAKHIQPGMTTIDATCGNGHDTVFLARAVGPTGRVHGFDIQETAIAETRRRLDASGLLDRVVLERADHAAIDWPAADVVMFNLGYLPGGDHALTTESDATIRALNGAREALKPGGLLSVVCYPGHPEGASEAVAVAAWAERQHGKQEIRNPDAAEDAPFGLIIRT